ncbi:MAG TPA: histidine kinase dimerization/phosphoacceptor domain -containing protein [Alphaproteobacteria bacterium]|nr:histidine kinase dimerization/phosphoacceptor domain -containing protein [Alphaproteobacteria bacterium]
MRYLGATLLVLAALIMRMALNDALANYPFILFYPVVILAALLFDRGTGIYATLLSGLLALYFFLPPRDSGVIFDGAILVPLALFLVTCGIAALIIEMLHSVNERYAAALARAEKAERVRETLMREMSHRIKNKLQFLAATFNAHARSGGDVKEIMHAAVSRIGVIARVHNTLFDQAGDSTINARDFLSGLCGDLQVSLLGERPIMIWAEADPFELDLDRATTLGILVSELVTNAAKHAFADREVGNVSVRLRSIDDSICELVVQDDGIGIREDAAQGFGSKVIRIMVEQLHGKLKVANGRPGATFNVTFPLAARSARTS